MRVRTTSHLDLTEEFSRHREHNEVTVQSVVGDTIVLLLPIEFELSAAWKMNINQSILALIASRYIMDGYRPLGVLPMYQELTLRCTEHGRGLAVITLHSGRESIRRSVRLDLEVSALAIDNVENRKFALTA